jgi:ketosteroid isomerase-like protein
MNSKDKTFMQNLREKTGLIVVGGLALLAVGGIIAKPIRAIKADMDRRNFTNISYRMSDLIMAYDHGDYDGTISLAREIEKAAEHYDNSYAIPQVVVDDLILQARAYKTSARKMQR